MLEPIQNLIDHLINYKDAVILVGNDAVKEMFLFQPTENNKDFYCRKALSKTPKDFWDFYKINILSNISTQHKNEAQKQIEKLIDLNIAKALVDLNCDGYLSETTLDYMPLRGNRLKLLCSKCHKQLDLDINKILVVNEVLNHNDYEENYECNGKIIPTIPFYGSKSYDNKLLDNLYNNIFVRDGVNFIGLNTHTLIFIGIDFQEDLLHDIAMSFNLLKTKESKEKGEKFYTVFITDHNEDDLEFYKADFGTIDNISESIERLIKLIKGE